MSECTTCKVAREKRQGQWWHLAGYYGFTGFFCPDCYDKISHNSYGQPNRPRDHLLMLLKFGDTNVNHRRSVSI